MNNDVKAMTDKQLEEIIRRAQNTHVPGSLFSQAKNEFDLRNKQSEQSDRDELRKTLDTHLIRINQTLDYIYKKPLKAAIYALASAVAIGVVINVLSALLIRIFHLN